VTPERALSLTQPWATLVASGAKRVETRSWRTPHRGALAVHASAGFPGAARALCGQEPFRSALRAAGFGHAAELPRGALVGCVRLVDVVPAGGVELAGLGDVERAFGDYSPGRWGWLLEDAVTYAVPVACRGALGVWRVAS
jgi:hypothetical protein